MPSLLEVEERAIKVVKEAGEVLQCDLWKALNVSSREGSRIALRLERKGLVKREPVIYNKRATFKLVWVGGEAEVGIEVDDCPCFSCSSIERCAPGQALSPGSCSALTRWLLQEAASLEAAA
jgi:hypothetical protein